MFCLIALRACSTGSARVGERPPGYSWGGRVPRPKPHEPRIPSSSRGSKSRALRAGPGQRSTRHQRIAAIPAGFLSRAFERRRCIRHIRCRPVRGPAIPQRRCGALRRVRPTESNQRDPHYVSWRSRCRGEEGRVSSAAEASPRSSDATENASWADDVGPSQSKRIPILVGFGAECAFADDRGQRKSFIGPSSR
jgi:hypothetical protein